MFIVLVGTPSAGKRTILEYLVSKHGFQRINLSEPKEVMEAARIVGDQLEPDVGHLSLSSGSTLHSVSNEIDPSPLPSPSPSSSSSTSSPRSTFSSPNEMLDHTTRNWLSHFVTTDLRLFEEIEPFLKRPHFLLVGVDGPLRVRFGREKERSGLTLDQFIDQHDLLLNGSSSSSNPSTSISTSTSFAIHPETDFSRVMKLASVTICNNFENVDGLWRYLDSVNLMDEERLRPGWDTYFMTLASLASHRSNCMKRRVGALLVRSKRILSTGYNGTPRGTRNCNQGGCVRCNGTARGGESLGSCLCLHAEENALLEAGRERIGDDSVLYCNTCPCLTCSVKIVQCGVREVVYNQSYSMDTASAAVLKEGGVVLRQLHMPR